MNNVDKENSQTGSYISHEFSADVDNEIRRLEAQVALFWEEEKAMYDSLGISGMGKVLDCGSGPGHLVKRLAKSYPQVQFYSLEMDAAYCSWQQETVKKERIQNISIIQGTIEQNGIKPGSLDLIIIRLVLEHVTDIEGSFKVLKGLLKPGGRLIAIDNDFSLHLTTAPPVRSLDTLYEAYCNARAAEGGDPYIGRRLPTYLKKYGFSDVSLKTLTVHSAFSGDAAFLKSESSAVGMVLVKKGFLAADDFEKLAHEWRGVLSAEDHSFMRILFFCTGISSQSIPVQESEAVGTEKSGCTAGTGSGEQNYTVREFLVQEIQRLTRNILTDTPDYTAKTLIHLGIDSINALDLADSVKKRFNVDIETVYLLDESTIDMLTERIESSKGGGTAEATGGIQEEGEL